MEDRLKELENRISRAEHKILFLIEGLVGYHCPSCPLEGLCGRENSDPHYCKEFFADWVYDNTF